MVDTAPLIATAQRLITENGRSVTLVQLDTTLQDSDRPWLGPADARAVPESTLVLDGVFVTPSDAAKLGISLESDDMIKLSEKIMMISPGPAVDISIYDEVIDGSDRLKIVASEQLKPGDELLIAFMGLAE